MGDKPRFYMPTDIVGRSYFSWTRNTHLLRDPWEHDSNSGEQGEKNFPCSIDILERQDQHYTGDKDQQGGKQDAEVELRFSRTAGRLDQS